MRFLHKERTPMFDQLRRSLSVLTLASLLTGSALAGGEAWTENFADAQKAAETDKKDLLLEFTGSDWCPPCKELAKNVFSHDAFAEGAGIDFVLVKLDYPNAPQSDELKAQNQALAEKYAIEGFPTVVLADAAGRPYAQTGFRPGGPEQYLAHLAELKETRVTRDEHFAAADKAEGIAKAKHLHEALQAVGDDLAVAFYGDTVEQILELDSDNAAGLKGHYESLYRAQLLREKLQAILGQARPGADGASLIKQLDELLADKDLPSAFRQEALMSKSELQYGLLEDMDAAKATLQEAIDADPDTETAQMLRSIMQQVFGDKE